MTSAKLWFARRQCSERQTNSRAVIDSMVTLCSDLCLEFAGQSCGTTVTVWSVSVDKRPCFHAGSLSDARVRDDSLRSFLSNGGASKKRKEIWKREGNELTNSSTPMHFPTPFASSCSLVAGNYRRGNFWYVSNDGKGSLLDLDAFSLPFLFFFLSFLFFFFFSPVTEFTHRVVRSR